MDEAFADRDDKAQHSNSKQIEDFAADLASSLWSFWQADKKVAEPKLPVAVDAHAEKASGTDSDKSGKDKGLNSWKQADRKGEKDQIKLEASRSVSFSELKKYNPELNEKTLKEQIGKSNLKMRHASTNELDGGWSLSGINADGSLQLQKNYELEVNATKKDRKGSESLIESLPGVPESHRKALEKKLSELPENVLKALSDSGYKIIAARKITDAIGSLEGKTPRGWPKDSTFDNSDGTHDNLRRLIIAPLIYDEGKNDWTPVQRPEVVVHQIGHALDHALGKLSNDPEFQRAFKRDMEVLAKKDWLMTDREKLIYEYFNQAEGPEKGERPGSEECFASLFGLLLTGPENPQDKKPFNDNFPNTIAVVKKQIASLGKKD